MDKKSKKFGRPTKYKKEYCQAIIDWFSGEPVREGKKTFTTKAGTVIEEDIILPEKLPLFENFAHSIGVDCSTIVEWAKKFPEFSSAYIRAKELQKAFLINNGILGLYNPQFTIFVAKNVTDMRDKQQVEFPDREGNPQSIGLLGDLDRANRLLFLIETIKKRKEIEGLPDEKNG
jgi:hypothetical protein